MKKIVLTLIFGLIYTYSLSQTESINKITPVFSSGVTDDEYLKLEKDYIEMLQSPEYKEYLLHVGEFSNKVGYNVEFPSWKQLASDENFAKNWLEKNLSKTNFNSYDEVRSMVEKAEILKSNYRRKYPNVEEAGLKLSEDQFKKWMIVKMEVLTKILIPE